MTFYRALNIFILFLIFVKEKLLFFKIMIIVRELHVFEDG